jgi:hypothetical protein
VLESGRQSLWGEVKVDGVRRGGDHGGGRHHRDGIISRWKALA